MSILVDVGRTGVAPERGKQYFAREFGTLIEVVRVSKEGKWADIKVNTFTTTWRKRQPLWRGAFPFAVTEVQ